MDNQTFFNTVALHLLNQGTRAANEHGVCLYRGPDGTKCAAGVMIPDCHYHPDMEQTSIDSVLSNNPELEPYFPSIELATSLQNTHDSSEPGTWFAELRGVARKFNLSTDALWAWRDKEYPEQHECYTTLRVDNQPEGEMA